MGERSKTGWWDEPSQQMGSSAELTLGCRPLLHLSSPKDSRELAAMEEKLNYRHQLEAYTKALEEERRKIDAFKRELPLCMQLLNNAIEGSKAHLAELTPTTDLPTNLACDYEKMDLHNGSEDPILEEFMPQNSPKDRTRKLEEQIGNRLSWGYNQSKPSWVVQAQPWSEPPDWADMHHHEKNGVTSSQRELEELGLDSKQSCSSTSKLVLNSTHRSGGAFSPFVRGKQWEGIATTASEDPLSEAKLTLSSGLNHPHRSPAQVVDEVGESRAKGLVETQVSDALPRRIPSSVMEKGSRGGSLNSGHEISEQAQRKARRCWSPELHRLFLRALEQLGGSQAATPKQIRELMKIDGLTNDEVKSHLQKYRLHTRRSSPVPLSSASPSTQVVVLGGIWMAPDYDAVSAAMQKNSSVYDPVPTLHQPSYLSNSRNESRSHTQSSAQEEIHHPVYFEQQPASLSKTSSQGCNQSPCQLSLCLEGSSEGCGDASTGNDAKCESTSRKGDFHGGTQCFRDNRPCRINLHGMISREQLEEDDDGDITEAEVEAEAEDSRGNDSINNAGHAN